VRAQRTDMREGEWWVERGRDGRGTVGGRVSMGRLSARAAEQRAQATSPGTPEAKDGMPEAKEGMAAQPGHGRRRMECQARPGHGRGAARAWQAQEGMAQGAEGAAAALGAPCPGHILSNGCGWGGWLLRLRVGAAIGCVAAL
jgi:hypothetical protein